MIPYFQWTTISLGPLDIQVWGFMVALGMLVALWVSVRRGEERGLKKQHILDAAFWIILGSILGSRIAYVLSEWSLFAGNFADVFKVWEGGMSISGGFAGSVVAGVAYFMKHQLPVFEYADVIVFGLPIGLWIGRLGCFFIFDHPGRPTSFFLGQAYADDVVRHNHGLYLSLNGLALSIFFYFMWKKNPDRTPGWYSSVFLVWYGVVRFSLDFYRAYDLALVDSRFFGLTMAQYLSLAMVAGGGYLWYRIVHASTAKKTKSK